MAIARYEPGTASIICMIPSPIAAIITVKPIDTPNMCGTVRRNPKLMADAISIRLFGPGVIEETSAKTAKATKSSVVITADKITQRASNVLALLRKFASYLQ